MTKESDLRQFQALAAQLATTRAQVKAHGGFMGDRDLHQCPACSLMEDVLCGGKLVTCWHLSAQPVDTGLLFKEVGAEQLACPGCGCVSLALETDIE
ncbi:hypothetical protein [Limnohabitans sp. WS1]|uniref:hypothetical protein n=1 Tax=Limnohabitans sp. WS1 TaxID=1100726 RepID=UPI000D3789DE|nr:hypothetical protein [Limnohabitans sp. WS1]PUE15191.1 hypothetical protein B9Z48_12205 [Limnohabitans sp. WS1]